MSADPEIVVAVVRREDGRVLMVKRKHPEGSLRWAFPGGKIESSELEKFASQREVKEESGVDCVPIRKIGQWRHPETDREISYWLCRHSGGRARVGEPNVISKVKWLTPRELRRVVTSRIFPPVAVELGLEDIELGLEDDVA